jgi:hypothetical protein
MRRRSLPNDLGSLRGEARRSGSTDAGGEFPHATRGCGPAPSREEEEGLPHLPLAELRNKGRPSTTGRGRGTDTEARRGDSR